MQTADGGPYTSKKKQIPKAKVGTDGGIEAMALARG